MMTVRASAGLSLRVSLSLYLPRPPRTNGLSVLVLGERRSFCN